MKSLYIIHALSRFNCRAFDFAMAIFLFLLDLHASTSSSPSAPPDGDNPGGTRSPVEIAAARTLLLPAVYALSEFGVQVLFGQSLRNWIEKTSRARFGRITIFLQQSMMACCLLLIAEGARPRASPFTSQQRYALLIGIFASGGIATFANMATAVALEKDWTGAVSTASTLLSVGIPSDSELDRHKSYNTMRNTLSTIDLTCKVAAPIVVGIVTHFYIDSFYKVAIAMAAWAVVSCIAQLFSLECLINECPRLWSRRERPREMVHRAGVNDDNSDEQQLLMPLSPHDKEENWDIKAKESKSPSSFSIFLSSNCAAASISLAVLYCTVLNFGTMMLAFLTCRGIPVWILGLARGGSSLIGLLASMLSTCSQRRIGSRDSANLGLWWQAVFLVVAVMGCFFPLTDSGEYVFATDLHCIDQTEGPRKSVFLLQRSFPWYLGLMILMVSVGISRFGLYLSDLSITKLISDNARDIDAAAIWRVHVTLANIFMLVASTAGLLFHKPSDFGYLSIASAALSVLASLFFSFWAMCCIKKKNEVLLVDLAIHGHTLKPKRAVKVRVNGHTTPAPKSPPRLTPTPDTLMALQLKTLLGLNTEIPFKPNDTLMDLKRKIELTEGTPYDAQQIFFDGEMLLDNNKSLESLGLNPGAQISLVPTF